MRRVRRFAGWSVAALVIITLVLLEFRGKEHGAELVRRVLDAPPSDVRRIMTEGTAWKKWGLPQLEQAVEEPVDTHRGINARLALLDSNPSHVPALTASLLEADTAVFSAVCQALEGRQDIPVQHFKTVLQDSSTALGQKLRTFTALAIFTPADPLIREKAPHAAQWLLTAVDTPSAWAALQRPVVSLISPALETALTPTNGLSKRRAAAAALASLHAGNSHELLRLLRLVPPDAVPLYAEELRSLPEAAEQMAKAVDAGVPGQYPLLGELNDAGESAYKGQANMLLASLRMETGKHVWPHLTYEADRTLRTFVFLNAATAGVPPERLLNHLLIETNSGIVQALLLALCGYPHSGFSASQQQQIIVWLRQAYVKHPNGGVHSAIATLLNRWSLGHELQLLDKSLPRTPKPAAGMSWWVTDSGIDMRIITLPGRRHVAVGAHEVTRSVFNHQPSGAASAHDGDPAARQPITGISWIDAAAFCLELSRKEKIPAELWCYQPEGDSFVSLSARPAQRGYRMPTKEEWRAASASAPDRWDFGKSLSVILHFAWLAENAGDVARPVASLLPNSLGLWDTLGNAIEWTHDVENPNKNLPICPLAGFSYISVRSQLSDTTWPVASISFRKPQAGVRLAMSIASGD